MARCGLARGPASAYQPPGAFSSEVDTGSREEPKVRVSEHAIKQDNRGVLADLKSPELL
jgi:hypothetical protein